MSLSIETLNAMEADGMSAEGILAYVKAALKTKAAKKEAKLADKREKDRLRQQEWRKLHPEKSRASHVTAVTSRDTPVNGAAEPLPVAAVPPSVSQQVESLCETQVVTNSSGEKPPSSFLPSLFSGDEEGRKEEGVTRAREGRRPKRAKGVVLPEDWMPKLHHYREGADFGLNQQQVDRQAGGMCRWARSNAHRAVARKSDWDATFSNWMDRNSQELGNGPNRQSGRSSGGKSVSDWQSRRDDFRAAHAELKAHIAENDVGEGGSGQDVRFAPHAGRE